MYIITIYNIKNYIYNYYIKNITLVLTFKINFAKIKNNIMPVVTLFE